MRVLHERPKVTDAPPAEADLIIEEARRRQRRRWRVGTALVVMALVGVSLAYVAGGFGGNGPKAASLGSAHPGGPAVGQSSSKGSVPAISEAGVMPTSEISVDDGLIAVMSGSGASCSTKLLNPRSLQAVRSVDSCPTQGTKDDVVASLGRFNLQQIRVMATNPQTGQKSLGPFVLSVQAWDSNHSAVAEGNGAVWIYGLAESSGPSPLLEVSTATGRVLHRFSVQREAIPPFVDDDGAWITPSAWGGSSCTGSCTLWHVAPRLEPTRRGPPARCPHAVADRFRAQHLCRRAYGCCRSMAADDLATRRPRIPHHLQDAGDAIAIDRLHAADGLCRPWQCPAGGLQPSENGTSRISPP